VDAEACNNESRASRFSKMPDVSVIIPAYNSATLIGATLDSALSQRDVSLEIIVVDDGSTDGTWSVLETYGDKLRCVRQANKGAYAARNLAATLATGEWLAFLDADDIWADDKLKKQLQLGAAQVGLIYSDYHHLDESGRVTGRTSHVAKLAEGLIFERLLVDNFIGTSTVLIRRTIFEKLGGFATDISGCADWDMWLRYTVADREVRVHPDPLASYRWHSAQMSKSFAARQRNRLEVIERAIKLARELGRPVSRSLERRAYGNSWATAAWFVAASDHWQASRWCLRALAWQPLHPAHYKLLIKSLLSHK
jgi:glycosyltransferase involved in cell wall biosynthesis